MTGQTISRRHFLTAAALTAATTALPLSATANTAAAWSQAKAIIDSGRLGNVLYAQCARSSATAFAESLAPILSTLNLHLPINTAAAGTLPAQGVITLTYPGNIRVVLTTAMAPQGRAHAFIRGAQGLLEITEDAVILTTNEGNTERTPAQSAAFHNTQALTLAKTAITQAMATRRTY